MAKKEEKSENKLARLADKLRKAEYDNFEIESVSISTEPPVNDGSIVVVRVNDSINIIEHPFLYNYVMVMPAIDMDEPANASVVPFKCFFDPDSDVIGAIEGLFRSMREQYKEEIERRIIRRRQIFLNTATDVVKNVFKSSYNLEGPSNAGTIAEVILKKCINTPDTLLSHKDIAEAFMNMVSIDEIKNNRL